MKYALVNERRSEAQPGLIGRCPCCDHATISKCGKIKVSHWAHKGRLMCDKWWENETEWHLKWKNLFPNAWQEIVQISNTGEKHIADVKTDHGLVVEFQHSSIKSEEIKSREFFYKNMIWIIDGTRRKNDKKKFILAWQWSRNLDEKIKVRTLDETFGEECPLIRDWRDSSVPFFFDFGDDILYGLLPKTINGNTYVFEINRIDFIESLTSTLPNFEKILENITDCINSRIMKKKLVPIESNFQTQQINLQQNNRHNIYRRFQRRRHWPL